MESAKASVVITRYGYSDDPVHDAMAHKLGQLAAEWRRTKDERFADEYRVILRALVLLGFDDELPIDVELPESEMPQEYLSLFA